MSSCSCSTVLPGPSRVLLSKTNKSLFPPLYVSWINGHCRRKGTSVPRVIALVNSPSYALCLAEKGKVGQKRAELALFCVQRGVVVNYKLFCKLVRAWQPSTHSTSGTINVSRRVYTYLVKYMHVSSKLLSKGISFLTTQKAEVVLSVNTKPIFLGYTET